MTYREELSALRARKDDLEAEVRALRERCEELDSSKAELDERTRELGELRDKMARLQKSAKPAATRAILGGTLLAAAVGVGSIYWFDFRRAPPLPEVVSEPPPAPAPSAPPPAPSPPPNGEPNVVGTVFFDGEELPEMAVPRRRADAEWCRDQALLHNAIVLTNDRIADVVVALAVPPGGDWPAPPVNPEWITERACVPTPRIVAVQRGRHVRLANEDVTTHHVQLKQGTATLLNALQSHWHDMDEVEMSRLGVHTVGCAIHPWERSFILVFDHPYFAVSDRQGAFALPHVPPGRYTLTAWHSYLGPKEQTIVVDADRPAVVRVAYDGSEDEPPENRGELDALF